MTVADGADVFALKIDWRQFRMPSWNVIEKVMKGIVLVDGRNLRLPGTGGNGFHLHAYRYNK